MKIVQRRFTIKKFAVITAMAIAIIIGVTFTGNNIVSADTPSAPFTEGDSLTDAYGQQGEVIRNYRGKSYVRYGLNTPDNSADDRCLAYSGDLTFLRASGTIGGSAWISPHCTPRLVATPTPTPPVVQVAPVYLKPHGCDTLDSSPCHPDHPGILERYR